MTDITPATGLTLHLAPREVWERQASTPEYTPESFVQDGFIHCTDGDDDLIAVGNRYYTGDRRAFVALTIQLDRVAARTVYEDAARIFPHIYGLLETAAVIDVRDVRRGDGGEFLGIG